MSKPTKLSIVADGRVGEMWVDETGVRFVLRTPMGSERGVVHHGSIGRVSWSRPHPFSLPTVQLIGLDGGTLLGARVNRGKRRAEEFVGEVEQAMAASPRQTRGG